MTDGWRGWSVGRRLAFERRIRGWHEEELAERLGRLAAFLGQPDPDLDAFAVESWECGGTVTPARLMLISVVLEVPAHELVGLLDPLALPEWGAVVAQVPGTIDAEDEVLRREFLRLTAVVLGGVAALDPERFDVALSRRVQVDLELLGQLRCAIRQSAGQYDALPAGLLRQRAAGLTESVKALLTGPVPGGLRRELLSVGAEAATLAGWASRSDGRPRQAAGYYAMAEMLAEAAGDGYLLAFISTRTADLSSGVQRGVGRAGDTGPVRPLLDRAEDLADPSAPAALRAHVMLRQAEEHAAAGEVSEAANYQDRADQAVTIAEAGRDGLYGIPWGQGVHDCYRGNITLLAGRPDLAAAILERVLRDMPAGTISNRSSVLADLGAAYARQKEVDHACEVLAEAWQMAQSVGLQHRAGRVQGVRDQHLSAYAGEPAVRRLDDRLASR